MVRHNDGIREIAKKLERKAKELSDQFKRLSGGQKVAVILLKIARVVSLVFSAKTAYEIKKNVSELNSLKYAAEQEARQSWLESMGIETIRIKTVEPDRVEIPGVNFPDRKEILKQKILAQSLKGFIGLLTAFISLVSEKMIKASAAKQDHSIKDRDVKRYIDYEIQRQVAKRLRTRRYSDGLME
jgi:hypothetical protein